MLTSSIIKYLFIYFFTYLLTYLLTLTWCIDTAYISPEEAWVDADNGGKGMWQNELFVSTGRIMPFVQQEGNYEQVQKNLNFEVEEKWCNSWRRSVGRLFHQAGAE